MIKNYKLLFFSIILLFCVFFSIAVNAKDKEVAVVYFLCFNKQDVETIITEDKKDFKKTNMIFTMFLKFGSCVLVEPVLFEINEILETYTDSQQQKTYFVSMKDKADNTYYSLLKEKPKGHAI